MKFLVGVDDSEASQVALDSIVRMCRPEADQIDLVHFEAPMAEQYTKEDDSARALVSRLETRIAPAGIPVSGLLVRGDPRQGLCEAAATRKADCLVVGARGVGLLQSVLFGSVSSSVLHTAETPVLVLKTPFPPTTHRRYLYCHDGIGGTSRRAFETMLALAKPGDMVLCAAVVPKLQVSMRIQLLTGCDPNMQHTFDEVTAANITSVQQQLEACVRECIKHKLEGTEVFKIGDPKTVLLDVCADNAIDIVVLGSRRLTAMQRFMVGSVSNTMVNGALCHALLLARSDGSGSADRAPVG